MKRLALLFSLAVSLHGYASHLINRREEQQYLKNLDTIVLNHTGTSRLVFNSDTIFIKMEEPITQCSASVEQKWLDRHPVIFTFIVALFTVLVEVELLKLALKK